MTLFFRRATPDDAETVHALVKSAFAEYDGNMPVQPGALRETLDEVKQDIESGNVLLVLQVAEDPLIAPDNMPDLIAALNRGEPVGTVRYEVKPDHLYVGRLAVRPDCRGQSIGTRIMLNMEYEARELGLTRIRLGTRESMPGNVAFYERLGYTIVERVPHPRGPDVILWFEKELEGADTLQSLQNPSTAANEP